MATTLFKSTTLVASDTPGLGPSNPVSCVSDPIPLKGNEYLGLAVTVYSIWGANAPNLRVFTELSNDGVNFKAGGPASVPMTADGTDVSPVVQVAAAFARLRAQFTIGVGVPGPAAAVTFDASLHCDSA